MKKSSWIITQNWNHCIQKLCISLLMLLMPLSFDFFYACFHLIILHRRWRLLFITLEEKDAYCWYALMDFNGMSASKMRNWANPKSKAQANCWTNKNLWHENLHQIVIFLIMCLTYLKIIIWLSFWAKYVSKMVWEIKLFAQTVFY